MEHYTQAASILNITQPTLTYAIHTLETELGVELFEKNGRNIVLTKAGRIFLEEIDPALAGIDRSIDKMRLIREGKEQIDVGFPRVFGLQYIPKLLSAFRNTADGKNVNYSFHNVFSPQLIEMLKNRKCDLVFCSYCDEDPAIHYVPVAKREFVFITPKDHPLAEDGEISLEEIACYPQIVFKKNTGLRHTVEQMFLEKGLEMQICMEVEEAQVIAGFVAENFGVAIVPDMTVLDMLPLKKRKIRETEVQEGYYMAYLKDKVHSPAVQRLISFVENMNQTDMLIDRIYL